MKRSTLIFLAVILMTGAGAASGDDYVRFGYHLDAPGHLFFRIPFEFKHDSPDSPPLTMARNGFVVTTEGPATIIIYDIEVE
ncbi:MAG: hypothetical protein ABIK83_01780 [Candidatus Zixiibacteriota bacterium]